MTDRLTLPWPDPAPFVARDGRPIRILAVSDEPDPTLDSAVTRERIGAVDMVIGAGDLEPDYEDFSPDNGPFCGPTCSSAEIAVTLTR